MSRKEYLEELLAKLDKSNFGSEENFLQYQLSILVQLHRL